MLADRGYDADWYREVLEGRGITPCIPSRKGRKVAVPHGEARYRKRQDREQLRSPQGLEACRNTLRQVPKGLPVRMRSGRRRHVLAMNPGPKGWGKETKSHIPQTGYYERHCSVLCRKNKGR